MLDRLTALGARLAGSAVCTIALPVLAITPESTVSTSRLPELRVV